MMCVAPHTGTDCSETYAEHAGNTAFWAYRVTYLALGSILVFASAWELFQTSKNAASVLPNSHLRNGGYPMQQNYQKSVYLRLIVAGVVFMLSAIDPLGYADIIGVNVWLIFSGVSTFFVLSVCISLIFVVVRRIALVGSKHGVLPYFNSLYLYSQIGIAFTWVALPIVQALISQGYVVEAIKLFFSSAIFLTWTIGSLAYGMVTLASLKESGDKKHASSNNLSSESASDVLIQRLSLLRVLNQLLFFASFLSVIFVAVQTVDAVHAIRTKNDVNFDIENDIPTGFGDLFVSGLFETIKQLFCFVILGGMRFVRVSRTQTRDSEDEAIGSENIPLAEYPDAGSNKLNNKEEYHDDDESHSSQTSILESHNAAA